MFGFLDLDHPVAVRHQNGALSYREFAWLVGSLAERLERVGLEPGDRVAVIFPNSLELLCSYYAGLLVGLVVVPINERLTPPEVARIVDHSEPRCLLTTPECADGYRELAESATMGIVALERMHTWLAAEPDLVTRARPDWPSDHPAILFYTSGSTGAPKGALYSHRTLIDNARVFGNGLGITGDDHSVLCHCMASNFVFAQLTVPLLDRGAIVEVVDFGSVDQTLSAIEAGATLLSLIPWFGFQLIEAGRLKSGRPNRLRISEVGGDRVPLRYFNDFREVFGVTPCEHLGMTETNTSTVNPLAPGDLRIGSVGTPLPEVEIEIRNIVGESLPPGLEGEIWVQTPAAMEGYWNDPEKTSEVMKEGWVATGDAGHLDEDGYLWFTGRLKHIIICDGDNIHASEVEHEVAEHPLVEQASVVGLPHPSRGETVGAAVILGGGRRELTVPELYRFLKRRLSDVKIPLDLIVLDAFPHTPAGKLDRKAIVAMLLESREAADA